MSYKEYTEAKRGTSWKQKLKQTIDRLIERIRQPGPDVDSGPIPF